MSKGWIKIHRKIMEKSFYKKDSQKVHVWLHLLLCASFSEGKEESLGGSPYLCGPGEFTTGRRQLAAILGISESKIERILTYFEKIEQQIEQRKTSTNRLITIKNWAEYQQSEQQIEQRPNNDRTTTEQRVNTLKELKNYKNEKKEKKTTTTPDDKKQSSLCEEKESFFLTAKKIIDYLNQKAKKNFTTANKKNIACIKARFNEGRILEDFMQVIDTKCSDWLTNPEMNKFLRPETLFGDKFENYLNENQISTWEQQEAEKIEGRRIENEKQDARRKKREEDEQKFLDSIGPEGVLKLKEDAAREIARIRKMFDDDTEKKKKLKEEEEERKRKIEEDWPEGFRQ